MNKFTVKNYNKGFLFYKDLMAGVSDCDDKYLAYIISQNTGETLEEKYYSSLIEAISDINGFSKNWEFNPLGCIGCDRNKCKKCRFTSQASSSFTCDT